MFNQETLSKKFITKGFWLYFFSFLIAPLGYLIRLTISNDLTVAEVGIIYSIIGLVTLISAYNDLGFSESLQYFLPKYRIEKKYNYFKTAIFISLAIQGITAILIATVLRFLSDWLAIHYFHSPIASDALKIFALFFVGFNLFHTLEVILHSFQDIFWNKFFEFLRMLLIFGFTLIFFFVDLGSVFYYSLAWTLGTFLVFIFVFIYFLKKYKDKFDLGKIVWDKDMLKEYFKYALFVLITIQGAVILGAIDQQFAIYFLGPVDAGYYTNFFSLLGIYSILVSPLIGFLFPVVSELIAKKDLWKLKILLSFFYKYFGTIGIWLGLAFVSLGPVLAVILFGKKFLNSGILLSFAGWVVFLVILIGINLNVLAGLGKVKERAKIVWFVAILNIFTNLILIQFLGLWGIVIATMIGWFVMWILSYFVLNKTVDFRIDYTFWVKNLIVALIFFGIINFNFEKIFLLSDGARLYDLKNLLILMIVGMVVFVSVNYREFALLKNEIKKILSGQSK